MRRFLLLGIPALFAGGCSTERHLLDRVHTPLVEVSPERSEAGRDSESEVQAPHNSPAEREQRVFGPWP